MNDVRPTPITETPAARAAYLHIPFCRHRCGYCNFTLVAGRDELIDEYLGLLAKEMLLPSAWAATSQAGQPIHPADTPPHQTLDTLYLGGGTPSHLNVRQFEQLAICIHRHFSLADGYEWTIEVNPEDIDEHRLQAWAASGINRISLGLQSFDDEKLQMLERGHRRADVVRHWPALRELFTSISIDLIFAAPGESLSRWESDVQQTLDLMPDHISVYGLTYEPGTSFASRQARGELTEASEDVECDMYVRAIDRLTEAGFRHYEVSNFARPGHESRHNNTYWDARPYFAFGAGAARFIAGRRETNHRSVTTYMKRLRDGVCPVEETEQLEPEAAARECLVFAFRKLAGVSRSWFRDASGYEIDQLAGTVVRKNVEMGWMTDDGETIQLTRAGLLISDSLWSEII